MGSITRQTLFLYRGNLMISLNIDTVQAKSFIKSTLAATDDDWGQAFKSLALFFVRIYCVLYAAWMHARDIWQKPLAYWHHYTTEAAAPAPAQAPPKKTTRKPRPVKRAEVVITHEATTPTPQKTRRGRRRKTEAVTA